MISKIWSLVKKDNWRFLKYCTVGISGVFVNEFFLFFFTEFAGLFYLVSSVIAVEISIISNFTWNELWTFRDRAQIHKTFPKRLVKFNLVAAAGIILNVLILYLVTALFGLHYLLSNLFGIAAATLWNYFVNLKWTWKQNYKSP
jgi:dolichol-phosphate mannosyltransferase